MAGEAVVTWQKGSAKSFVVQRAADPANPATYAVPIPWGKVKFKVEGEKSASTIYFRVAATDSTSATGIGPWSEWVPCTVR